MPRRKSGSWENEARERIAALTRELVARHGVERTASTLKVARSTIYQLLGEKPGPRRAPRAVTLPQFAVLRRICDATGASADWLLGYAVPPDRLARHEGGDLARRVHDALRKGAPPLAPLSLLGDESEQLHNLGWSDAVIASVVAAWWEAQRTRLARAYRTSLRRLAERLRKDATAVGDARIATLMRTKARSAEILVAQLRGDGASWRELLRLRPTPLRSDIPGVTGRAIRFQEHGTVAFLEAPFMALGGNSGIGVAWQRSEADDEAWFIGASTLEVRHVAGRRFLKALTVAEAFCDSEAAIAPHVPPDVSP